MQGGDSTMARVHDAVAGRLADRLLDDMRASRRHNGLLSASYVATLLLVLPILLVDLGVAAAGTVLLWPGRTVVEKVLGVLALSMALAFRPRLGRSRGAGLLASSPATARLLADVARVVEGPAPTRLTVSADFNASVARSGLRGRTLTLGAPLWAALGHEERIALLGHELGHLANSDVESSRLVGSALTSLGHWTELCAMRKVALGRAYGFLVIAQIAFSPLHLLLLGYRRLIELVSAASHRRQEHYADLAAVVSGGSAAARRTLETLLLRTATETTATRARISGLDVYDAVRERFASYDETTFRNARHRAQAETSRVDSHHPPTLHRLALVESKPVVPAAVLRTAEEWEQIDAELLPRLRKQAALYADRRIHHF